MQLEPGTTIGDLTILHEERGGWVAKCKCGRLAIIRPKDFDRGTKWCLECEKTKSNGDLKDSGPNLKHGMSGTSVYKLWTRLKSTRKLCEDWEDFMAFYEDVGDRPTKEHILKRPNPKVLYGPDNAEWVTTTSTDRLYTRPPEIWVEYQGEQMTLTELAEETGVPKPTLHWRIQAGLTPEEAVAHIPYEPLRPDE